MNPIRFGVCGLGRIGVVHCRCFSREKDQYRLVTVCDQEASRVAAVSAEFACAGYADMAAFLASPEMELAVIATRSLDHVVHAAQALVAGKQVLLEKPIAVTQEDLRRLRGLDRDYPGRLFFLHNHRFEPSFQTIQRILASGVLGEVQMVKIRRHHAFGRRRDWQTLLEHGGGQLCCWGPHIIDQGLQLIQAPVRDIWSHLKRVQALGDADDHVKILLVGENGVVADLEISYTVALPEAYCTVYGSRGSLVCADEKTIRLKYIDPAYRLPDRAVVPGLPPPGGGFGNDEDFHWVEQTVKAEPEGNMWELVEYEIARHLYRAVREGVPFPVTNADALEVARVMEVVKSQNPQFRWP